MTQTCMWHGCEKLAAWQSHRRGTMVCSDHVTETGMTPAVRISRQVVPESVDDKPITAVVPAGWTLDTQRRAVPPCLASFGIPWTGVLASELNSLQSPRDPVAAALANSLISMILVTYAGAQARRESRMDMNVEEIVRNAVHELCKASVPQKAG